MRSDVSGPKLASEFGILQKKVVLGRNCFRPGPVFHEIFVFKNHEVENEKKIVKQASACFTPFYLLFVCF